MICGNTEVMPSELVGKIRFLNLVDPKTGKTNFHEEFKVRNFHLRFKNLELHPVRRRLVRMFKVS